MILAAFVSAE